MDTQPLIATGLTPLQAAAYAQLIEHHTIKPPELAAKLKTTRTNAYKLLDKLVELKLAVRVEQGKRNSYQLANPTALAELVSTARNKVTTQEEAVKHILGDLLQQYYQKTEQPALQIVTGRSSVAGAYRQQVLLKQPIYFIRSQADIPSMGYETMHDIRTTPARHGQMRYGITPDTHAADAKYGDPRSKLTRTWVSSQDYTAPVEWSVCGPSLLIVLFGAEPHAVTINNPAIADAFRQLWHILDIGLRAMPHYSELPRV